MDTLYELEMETFRVKLTVQESELTPARSVEDVYRIASPIYAGLDVDVEHFGVLLLNNKNRVRAFKVISTGSLTAALVHPREVFRVAVLWGAAALILLHNHPSGDPAPSQEDIEITRRLKYCADTFGIRLLDHVVLGADRYFSFADRGLLDGVIVTPSAAPPVRKAPVRKVRSDKGKARGASKRRAATLEQPVGA